MKTWETPKLIVLVRNNPAEAVLSVCKGDSTAIFPTSYFAGCTQYNVMANLPTCANCSTVNVS